MGRNLGEQTLVKLCIILVAPFVLVAWICQTSLREARLLFRSLRRRWACARPTLLPWTNHLRKRRELQNTTRSAFLKLPGELRNRIYDLAAPGDRVIELITGAEYRLSSHGQLQGHLQLIDNDYYLDGPKLRGIANMTQVCRALRSETLAHFHSRNSFAFHHYRLRSRADKHSKKWNSDVERGLAGTPMERWLMNRPKQALPFLKVILMTRVECPASHHEAIRRAHNLEPREPTDPWSFRLQRRVNFHMTGKYAIMLDFADSRSLKLVRGKGWDEGGLMVLHDCEVCLERVEGKWKEFGMSDEWRSARDAWHDGLDAGTLSWKDALRMIDLIRDCGSVDDSILNPRK